MISSQGHDIERPKHSTRHKGSTDDHHLESVMTLWNMLHPRELELSIRETVLLWYKNIRRSLNPMLRTDRLLQRTSAWCEETWSALRCFMVSLWNDAHR